MEEIPEIVEHKIIECEELEHILKQMVSDPYVLKNGYKILSEYEMHNKFLLNLLNIAVNPETQGDLRKLVCSTLKLFMKKNWDNEMFISYTEKMAFLELLMQNLTTSSDYYMKNFISTILGIIASKEQMPIVESFLKVILERVSNTEDIELLDTFLRIVLSILNNCLDNIISISDTIIPVVLDIFRKSKNNQKNREKCLKIIITLFSKLCLFDDDEGDVISKHLDSNIEQLLSLFISVLISNPKFLFDIKKLTLKALDIFVRDMPNYSLRYIHRLIEPVWTLIVLELSLYTDNIIFNKKIEYEESELAKIEEENHNYIRGYESDEDDEKFGIEGLIFEVIDFAIDLFKRSGIKEAIQSGLGNFLLCIKGYCLMPHNSLTLWKNDANLYITEEYDDENINTVRNKTLSLIKELTKEIDDDNLLLNFIKILISEFKEGLDIENYIEVIKLDDYNLTNTYFDNMNQNQSFIFRRHESNLLILGNLAEDLVILKEKNILEDSLINNLTDFLFDAISNPVEDSNCSGVFTGRALWCISRLFSLVKDNLSICRGIFEAVSKALCHPKSDLSVCLVACLCLTKLCNYLKTQQFDHELIESVYERLIEILKSTTEETIIIPIETILSLSRVNKDKAMLVPTQASKLIIDIYSKHYNDPSIGGKILELIKFWSTDARIAKILIGLFIPFAIYVFDDFFKSLKSPNNNSFEDIKKTVMTEHGADMNFKTNLEMLPNLIDIISILTKYCVETGDSQNLVWVSMIVNVICEILINSNDIQILQRGTAFLKIYIPTCVEVITTQKQQDIFVKVIMRFFDPALLESSLLYVGNVVAQYFAHINKKLELGILDAIVKRIYKSRMPSIVQSLVLVFSRLIILHPSDIIGFLLKVIIESRVGLKVLIDKWLLHQPLFRGKYFKNISIKALTTLYGLKNNIVESLMVIGYDPSHSTASIEVNAPFKILSTLIRCLNNEILQEEMKNKKNDYDNMDLDMMTNEDGQDGYGEEEEMEEGQVNGNGEYLNGEDNNKLDIDLNEFKILEEEEQREFTSKLNFVNLQGKGGCLKDQESSSVAYVTEMMGFDYNDNEGEEEDIYEDDLEYLKDIDYDFELKDFLLDFFKNFKANNQEYLEECVKVLPKNDQLLYKSFNI